MLPAVISCTQIWLNTGASSQVCPGSKDSRATGFEPERSQQGQSPCGLRRVCASTERASVTFTHHRVKSINIKSQVSSTLGSLFSFLSSCGFTHHNAKNMFSVLGAMAARDSR